MIYGWREYIFLIMVDFRDFVIWCNDLLVVMKKR